MNHPTPTEEAGDREMGGPRLWLLGPPRIERDATPVHVDTRKAVALAAYLAMTPGWQARDILAALLWPDHDQSSARGALRRTLSSLNKALGETGLGVRRDSIELQEGVAVDVRQFRANLERVRQHSHDAAETCRACLELLSEAVALYRGDFLAGFSLRDSPEFDDWQFFQAETLRRELAQALEQLVIGRGAGGDLEEAIGHARRWLALDPLHEPPYRHLMRLYFQTGRRSAALRQYDECARVLEQELGASPSPETQDLYLALKEGRLPPGLPAAQGRASPVAQGLGQTPRPGQPVRPLVGRTAEREMLLESYTGINGDGRLLVVEGEAGIGKSRLAEELTTYVQAEGGKVLTARCYEGETDIAYTPFIDLLEQAVATIGQSGNRDALPEYVARDVSRLVPAIEALYPGLPPAPPFDSVGAQSRFLESVRQVLTAATTGQAPALLFLDDLHWADHASLELLAYLARRLTGWPICLLGTWRNEMLPPGHRLRRLLAEEQRRGEAASLHLGRLDRPAVLQLAGLVAPGGLTAEVGERLYQETEGLPLFVNEYLNVVSHDPQAAESGTWPIPGGVRDVLEARLAETGEVARHVLSTAAVLGRSFELDTLREASGRDEDLVVTALDELLGWGLIQEATGGAESGAAHYDFTHDKLRALVYEKTGLARRRLLHRRAADTLVRRARGSREADALAGSIAHHYRLAGEDGMAATYFARAGEYHRRLYANREALSHLESALALGHSHPYALHEAIGDVHTLLGDYGSAISSYQSALALGEAGRLPRVEYKLGNVHQRRGEWELAEQHYLAAEAGYEAIPSSIEQSRLYADWSLNAYHQSDPQRAAELAQASLALAVETGDARTRAQASNISGILARGRGDRAGAGEYLRDSLELARAVDDPAAQAAALNNLALLYAEDGQVEQAIEHAEAALKLAVSQGDRHREAALHNNLADLLHATGRSEAAITHLKQAVAIYAEIGVEAGTVQPEIWKLSEW